MNSIKGLGNDILEIERIRDSIKTHGQPFLDRLFTKKEQEYCNKQKDPAPRFAGRFAAKEAIVKALGSGFGEDAHWQDIEILPDPHGNPEVEFSDQLKKRFGNPIIHVSISHSKTYASAVAIWIGS